MMKTIKYKPYIELNHWYMREVLFYPGLFYKMENLNHIWYIIDFYLFRIGLEIKKEF